MESTTLIVSIDQDLHLQTENGQVVVSSRYIAERFGKQHQHVLRDIENIKTNGVSKIGLTYLYPHNININRINSGIPSTC